MLLEKVPSFRVVFVVHIAKYGAHLLDFKISLKYQRLRKIYIALRKRLLQITRICFSHAFLSLIYGACLFQINIHAWVILTCK